MDVPCCVSVILTAFVVKKETVFPSGQRKSTFRPSGASTRVLRGVVATIVGQRLTQLAIGEDQHRLVHIEHIGVQGDFPEAQ